jgi:hypothetical protein
MKRFAIGTLALLFIAGGIYGFQAVFRVQDVAADDVRGFEDGTGSGFLLAQDMRKPAQDRGQWVAKVDDTTISFDDFEREFNVHIYSLPIDDDQKKRYEGDQNNRKKFLVNLINEYLIYKRALKERYDKRSDVQDLLKAVTRRAIIQVYLNDKIEPKLTEIPDEQIEAIYNQNKKLFAGVDIDVARQQIRMQLLQKQYNEHLNDLIDSLKGEAKVVKNSDVNL